MSAHARDKKYVENRPASGLFAPVDLRELWRYRELAFFLALSDLKVRYKQTVFGVAWVVIQPLVGAAIFTLVFGRFAGLPSDGLPYVVFVYTGLTLWAYFSRAVESSADSLVGNPALVTKVYFPRILAPFAAVVPGILDLVIALVVAGVFMAIYHVTPSAAIILLPVWILAAAAVAFGAGLWLSALNVRYRDVRHTLSFLMQVWVFATPVVYPSALVDGAWRYLYAVNPMVGVLDGFRWSLTDTPAPSGHLLISLAAATVLLASGGLYFLRAERDFGDVI